MQHIEDTDKWVLSETEIKLLEARCQERILNQHIDQALPAHILLNQLQEDIQYLEDQLGSVDTLLKWNMKREKETN